MQFTPHIEARYNHDRTNTPTVGYGGLLSTLPRPSGLAGGTNFGGFENTYADGLIEYGHPPFEANDQLVNFTNNHFSGPEAFTLSDTTWSLNESIFPTIPQSVFNGNENSNASYDLLAPTGLSEMESPIGNNIDPNSTLSARPALHTQPNNITATSSTTQATTSSIAPGNRFPCSHGGCGKTFKREGDARRHEALHLPPQHHCPNVGCDRKGSKAFHRLDKLREHRRKKHGENI